MINENEKVYCICDNCIKTDSCNYYRNVIQTIKDYINTPLNIHFPQCKNYKSILQSIFENVVMPMPNNIDEIPEDYIKEVVIKALQYHFNQ